MQKIRIQNFSKRLKSIYRLPYFKMKNSLFCPCWSVFIIKHWKPVFSLNTENPCTENPYLVLNTINPYFFANNRKSPFLTQFSLGVGTMCPQRSNCPKNAKCKKYGLPYFKLKYSVFCPCWTVFRFWVVTMCPHCSNCPKKTEKRKIKTRKHGLKSWTRKTLFFSQITRRVKSLFVFGIGTSAHTECPQKSDKI